MDYLKDLRGLIDDLWNKFKLYIVLGPSKEEQTEAKRLLREGQELMWRSTAQADDIITKISQDITADGQRKIFSKKEERKRREEEEQKIKEEDENKVEAIENAKAKFEQAIDIHVTKVIEAEILSELIRCYKLINYWEGVVRSFERCLELKYWGLWGINKEKRNKLWKRQKEAYQKLISLSEHIENNIKRRQISRLIEKYESQFNMDEDVMQDLIDWRKEPPPTLAEQPV